MSDPAIGSRGNSTADPPPPWEDVGGLLGGIGAVLGSLIEADKAVNPNRDLLALPRFVYVPKGVGVPGGVPPWSTARELGRIERDASRVAELTKGAHLGRGLVFTHLTPLMSRLGVGLSFSPEHVVPLVHATADKLDAVLNSAGVGHVLDGLGVLAFYFSCEKAQRDPTVENVADMFVDGVGVVPVLLRAGAAIGVLPTGVTIGGLAVAPITAAATGGYSAGKFLDWAAERLTGTALSDIGLWLAEQDIQQRETLRAASNVANRQVYLFGKDGSLVLPLIERLSETQEARADGAGAPETSVATVGPGEADTDGDSTPDTSVVTVGPGEADTQTGTESRSGDERSHTDAPGLADDDETGQVSTPDDERADTDAPGLADDDETGQVSTPDDERADTDAPGLADDDETGTESRSEDERADTDAPGLADDDETGTESRSEDERADTDAPGLADDDETGTESRSEDERADTDAPGLADDDETGQVSTPDDERLVTSVTTEDGGIDEGMDEE